MTAIEIVKICIQLYSSIFLIHVLVPVQSKFFYDSYFNVQYAKCAILIGCVFHYSYSSLKTSHRLPNFAN